MNSHTISLKTRVRYEGRAQTIDRRAKIGADLEKIPNPLWQTGSLRTQLRRPNDTKQ